MPYFHNMKYGFHNDAIVPVSEFYVHISDLSIHRAYGVFDFFKLKDGTNLWLDWYLDRFFNSMKAALLQLPYTKAEVKNIVEKLYQTNNAPDSCIKLLCTGGLAPDGFTPSGMVNFFVLNYPIRPLPEVYYQEGVVLLSRHHRRTLPEIKSIDYFYSITQIPEMQRLKAIDVLYHYENVISETSRSNIFVVKNSQIFTPADHILQGITRRRILSAHQPFPIVQKSITLEELFQADEVFITSTTKGILPVRQIDQNIIGPGCPGPVTTQLSKLLAGF